MVPLFAKIMVARNHKYLFASSSQCCELRTNELVTCLFAVFRQVASDKYDVCTALDGIYKLCEETCALRKHLALACIITRPCRLSLST